MKAIGYIRVSTEEQAREGISLEAQEDVKVSIDGAYQTKKRIEV